MTVVEPPRGVPETVPSRCWDYVVAMENAGQYTLSNLMESGQHLELSTLLDIAVWLVQLLEEFHSRGFSHGKIHETNIVYFDVFKIGPSLAFVDLEKSIPFVCGTNRRHVTETSIGLANRDLVRTEDAKYKSVYQLLKNFGSCISRRDDWYMLAELLLKLHQATVLGRSLISDSITLPVKTSQVVSDRLERAYIGAPSVLLDMFEYSKTLGFSERPDYQYWFRRLVRTRAMASGESIVYHGRIVKDYLVGVRFHYARDYLSQVELVEEMMIASHKSVSVQNCPPRHIHIVERPGDGSPFEVKGGRLSDNVWSAIRRKSGGQMEGVIIKVTRRYWKEKIILEIFSDSTLTPAIYSVSTGASGASSECAARMIVMETAGSMDLEEYKMTRPHITYRMAAELAIRAIELLRAFHSRGFVHGDIHMGNFSLKKSAIGKDFVESMRLLDLDRSVAFVDFSAKRHVRERAYIPRDEKAHVTRLNKSMLSVYELEKYPNIRLSRRDDWFRFAEMILNVLVSDNDLFKRIRELSVRIGTLSPLYTGNILVAKQEREVDNMNVPKIFADLYKSSMELAFDQRPPYEEWMHRFTEYLQFLDD